MQGLKKYSLLFFSLALFSFLLFQSVGKSNTVVPDCSIQKHTTGSYSPLTNLSNWNPVNPYVRNKRCTKEDDHKLFFDALVQNNNYWKKPFKFILLSADHLLYYFNVGIISSRAPPVMN
jgi:hypothetical protein